MSRFKRKDGVSSPKTKLRNKMLRDIRAIREKRKKQTKIALYANRKKPPLYKFDENLDRENNQGVIFPFPKAIINSGLWAKLPTAAKSVFPVIASYRNKNNLAWPMDTTIGILCGRSTASVNKGTLSLNELLPDYFKMEKTKLGKKRYRLTLSKNNLDEDGLDEDGLDEDGTPDINAFASDYFLFSKYVLESGAWHYLKPAAHALYPVIRSLAWFNVDIYRRLVKQNYDATSKELYPNREFDFLTKKNHSKKHLAALAGINENSINGALADLQERRLIDIVADGYIVYLRTKNMVIYNRDELNKKVLKSFHYATDEHITTPKKPKNDAQNTANSGQNVARKRRKRKAGNHAALI